MASPQDCGWCGGVGQLWIERFVDLETCVGDVVEPMLPILSETPRQQPSSTSQKTKGEQTDGR